MTSYLAEMLKQHKMVRWQNINTPKNLFEEVPPRLAKKPHTDEASVSTSHVVSASSIVDKFSMTNTIATITDRSRCSSTKIGKLSSVCTEKRGKQSSTIQKPLSHKICHINLRTQNVSWNMEISHNHSNHPDLIMKIARPG